jgi:Fe-S-cluster containining protein
MFSVNRTRLFIKEPNDRDREFLSVRGFKPAVTPQGVGLEIIADSFVPCPKHRNDRCSIYDKRPEACRVFPEFPEQVAATPCSYWFEDEEGIQSPVGGDASPYGVKHRQYRELLELSSRAMELRTQVENDNRS